MPLTAHNSRHNVIPHSNHYFDYGRTLSTRTCTAKFSTDRKFTRSVVNQESIEPRPDTPPQTGAPVEKLVHLALPVRLTHMQNGERSVLELACTYDIHPRGARLLSFRNVNVGDLITVERGRNKSVCRVVWTA